MKLTIKEKKGLIKDLNFIINPKNKKCSQEQRDKLIELKEKVRTAKTDKDIKEYFIVFMKLIGIAAWAIHKWINEHWKGD